MNENELMTNAEIVERLDKGESALELSIEAWEKKVAYIDKYKDIPSRCIRTDTCALCIDLDTDCDRCVLKIKTGKECQEEGSPWVQLANYLSFYPPNPGMEDRPAAILAAAQVMLDTLKGLKET